MRILYLCDAFLTLMAWGRRREEPILCFLFWNKDKLAALLKLLDWQTFTPISFMSLEFEAEPLRQPRSCSSHFALQLLQLGEQRTKILDELLIRQMSLKGVRDFKLHKRWKWIVDLEASWQRNNTLLKKSKKKKKSERLLFFSKLVSCWNFVVKL